MKNLYDLCRFYGIAFFSLLSVATLIVSILSWTQRTPYRGVVMVVTTLHMAWLAKAKLQRSPAYEANRVLNDAACLFITLPCAVVSAHIWPMR